MYGKPKLLRPYSADLHKMHANAQYKKLAANPRAQQSHYNVFFFLVRVRLRYLYAHAVQFFCEWQNYCIIVCSCTPRFVQHCLCVQRDSHRIVAYSAHASCARARALNEYYNRRMINPRHPRNINRVRRTPCDMTQDSQQAPAEPQTTISAQRGSTLVHIARKSTARRAHF